MEQFKKATKAAEKAVTLDPDDHEARMILVSLYGNNPPDLGGDQSRAKHHVEALEKRSPVDGAVARCEFSLKNEPEKKLALWNDLAKKLGKDPRVHENLAREYAWGGNVEKATLHANKVLAFDPTRGQILLDLARAFGLDKEARTSRDVRPALPGSRSSRAAPAQGVDPHGPGPHSADGGKPRGFRRIAQEGKEARSVLLVHPEPAAGTALPGSLAQTGRQTINI